MWIELLRLNKYNLQDKRHRFYVVSALANTNIDLKGAPSFLIKYFTCLSGKIIACLTSSCVIDLPFLSLWCLILDHMSDVFKWSVLSQRLGLGKGGLRMAPEEALQELLQVNISQLVCFTLEFLYITGSHSVDQINANIYMNEFIDISNYFLWVTFPIVSKGKLEHYLISSSVWFCHQSMPKKNPGPFLRT